MQGHYTGNIKATNQDSNELVCVDIDFHLTWEEVCILHAEMLYMCVCVLASLLT